MLQIAQKTGIQNCKKFLKELSEFGLAGSQLQLQLYLYQHLIDVSLIEWNLPDTWWTTTIIVEIAIKGIIYNQLH